MRLSETWHGSACVTYCSINMDDQVNRRSFVKGLVALPGLARVAASQDEPVIKVDVNLVNVFCTVRGKNNALIGNLEKNSFQVFEDNKQQEIRYFTRETDVRSHS